MKIAWDQRAIRDIEALWEYIARDDMPAAEQIAELIYQKVRELADFPHIGRGGRIRGTRELVVYPYVIIYKIVDGKIGVKAILHGRRRWPRRL